MRRSDTFLPATRETRGSGMVHLVEGNVRSYEDLPLLLFQIASKFRDDHARNGLVRCKEFTMKDAYSFHRDERSLDATYQAMGDVYASILADLGVEFAVVEADNSVMGGSRSEEFVAPVENGSDDLLYCQTCRFGVTDEHEAFDRHGAGGDCPECGGDLVSAEGIEVGHVFKLGTRYADAMGLRIDTRAGDSRAVRMGSYGIGVERLLQTVAQQHADDDGLRWPTTQWGSIAPFIRSVVSLFRTDRTHHAIVPVNRYNRPYQSPDRPHRRKCRTPGGCSRPLRALWSLGPPVVR